MPGRRLRTLQFGQTTTQAWQAESRASHDSLETRGLYCPGCEVNWNARKSCEPEVGKREWLPPRRRDGKQQHNDAHRCPCFVVRQVGLAHGNLGGHVL